MTNLTQRPKPEAQLPDRWQDQRTTMRAWEDFLTFRDVERSRRAGVRQEILESWSRSLASGINAEAELAPIAESAADLYAIREKNTVLRAAARLPFSRIAPLLSDSDAILILTDEHGMVLDHIGDARTHAAAQRIHLTSGGNWSESVMGTNGIGTALRLGLPTVVHASEHFCQGIKAWTCAAAPIRDPIDHRVLGVVDLSGPPAIFRPHNLALAQTVAREIESALSDRQEQQRIRLLEAFLNSGPAHGQNDAVIILDQIGRVMYHRLAGAEGTGNVAHGLSTGQTLLSLSQAMSDHDIQNALPDHLKPTGISRLILDGTFSGAALILPQRRNSTAAPLPPQGPLRIASRAGAQNDELLVIGQNPAFLAAIDLAHRAAIAGTPVLIEGETGTGKELFARLVHGGTGKKQRPFVTLNCGAISADLFGSELFGHIAGAFTGAAREGKAGKFEQADGGVLCLDEIGEMPLELQPYLLRVLEQRAVYRIGCSRRRQVDVQLVAMTNRSLEQQIETGQFRRDLYYRIGTLTIEVPALRDRRDDIPALTEHFNRQVALRLGRDVLRLSDTVMERLNAYAWPGNVRELRNLLERLHLTCSGDWVSETDLPARIASAVATTPMPVEPIADPISLNDLEARAIRQMLVSEEGNLTKVAAALGISRPTLYRKLKAYGIRRAYN